jgi:hypothetical protein
VDYADPKSVKVGDIVYWYVDMDPNMAPQAAVVTHVGLDSVDLSAFAPDLLSLRTRTNVRHVKDPRPKNEDITSAGGWDWMPDRHRSWAMEQRIRALEEQLASLTGRAKSSVEKKAA